MAFKLETCSVCVHFKTKKKKNSRIFKNKFADFQASIYKFGLSWCLFVCLYPINVKTAERHHVTTGEVYK